MKTKTENEGLRLKESTKLIWGIGLMIILVGIIATALSLPQSCDESCVAIEGVVSERGVLTTGGELGVMKRDVIKHQLPQNPTPTQ